MGWESMAALEVMVKGQAHLLNSLCDSVSARVLPTEKLRLEMLK